MEPTNEISKSFERIFNLIDVNVNETERTQEKNVYPPSDSIQTQTSKSFLRPFQMLRPVSTVENEETNVFNQIKICNQQLMNLSINQQIGVTRVSDSIPAKNTNVGKLQNKNFENNEKCKKKLEEFSNMKCSNVNTIITATNPKTTSSPILSELNKQYSACGMKTSNEHCNNSLKSSQT